MGRGSNVLITCGGKWVGMVLQLKQTMQSLPELRDGRIVVAAMHEVTPAGCFADDSFVVPPIVHDDYVDKLLDLCRQNDVRVVVPLIDLDLEKLAPNRQRFLEIGTSVVCPKPELVDLCMDKQEFEEFARAEGLNYPQTYSPELLKRAEYPLFHKRRHGFGSLGSGVCWSYEDAVKVLDEEPDSVFQEYIVAPEVSVDAYISLKGECIVCVQRMRDKIVAGEAYQSHTIKSPAVRALAMKTAYALAARGLRGPLNIQMFAGDDPCLIEVNTRLGSASVLSNVATGGRLFTAVLSEACGLPAYGDPDDYIEGLQLDRFLGDVFHMGSNSLKVVPELKEAA